MCGFLVQSTSSGRYQVWCLRNPVTNPSRRERPAQARFASITSLFSVSCSVTQVRSKRQAKSHAIRARPPGRAIINHSRPRYGSQLRFIQLFKKKETKSKIFFAVWYQSVKDPDGSTSVCSESWRWRISTRKSNLPRHSFLRIQPSFRLLVV